MLEGSLIRIPIPELSEERRKELVKIASKYSEDCKVSIRNIRREAMEKIKSFEKNKDISKDESFKFSDQVQEMTDRLIEKIDLLFSEKKKIFLEYNGSESRFYKITTCPCCIYNGWKPKMGKEKQYANY